MMILLHITILFNLQTDNLIFKIYKRLWYKILLYRILLFAIIVKIINNFINYVKHVYNMTILEI